MKTLTKPEIEEQEPETESNESNLDPIVCATYIFFFVSFMLILLTKELILPVRILAAIGIIILLIMALFLGIASISKPTYNNSRTEDEDILS